MAKKLDYASMFTLRRDGRYCHTYTTDKGERKYIYDRDPQILYSKVLELEKPTKHTLKDAAGWWKDAKWDSFSSGTRCCYLPAYNRAIENHGDKLISEINAGDINAVLLWMRDKGYSQKTIKMQRTVYKLIFEKAIIDGAVIHNPAVGLKLPDGTKRPVKREAPEDDVIDTIKESVSCYFGLFPFFLLHTGLRKSEALALTWNDINVNAGEVSVTKALDYPANRPVVKAPKTSSSIRTVPLLSPLRSKLIRPITAKGTDLVFPGPDNQLMTISAYNRRWNRWCKEAGLVGITTESRTNKNGAGYTVEVYKPKISAHVLRHAYATILYEAGVDEFTAKELLGHADISTTHAIYTHLRNKQRDKGRAKLETYFSDDVVSDVVKDGASH